MTEIKIRTATVNDLPTLLEFEQGIIKSERPYDPTLDNDPICYYDIKELILSEQASVVVATFNEQLVASGYAQAKTAKPYLNHEKYSYLGFMFTHPDFRGRGINKMIIDSLKNWTKIMGLKEMRLTVYDDNIGAIKAYEKVGFKKHIVEMRIP